MRWLFSISLMAATLLLSCKTYQVSTQPVEVAAPDSLPDPQPANGWMFSRTSMNGGVFLPPQPVAGKVKNSYNTRNSQKKSNNTETKQKKSENTKAKGEGIIGDHNAPVEAKKDVVIGDGNTVEQEEQSLWWLWMLAGACLTAVGWAWWKR